MSDSESDALTGLGDTPIHLVRSERLELSWLSPQRPQRCASTNFATTAKPSQLVSCIWCCAPDASSLLSLTAHPTERLAGVVGFEPTNVGFRIRCLNRTWRYPNTSGAVGETRTLMALTTATSTLRVYQFRHDREMLTVLCLRSIRRVTPLIDLAGVVGFEPTNVGFRIRCLNRTWRYPNTSGAVGETRTLMALTTATSTLRVYQFRHDRETFSACILYLVLRTGRVVIAEPDGTSNRTVGRGSRIRTYECRIQNPMP